MFLNSSVLPPPIPKRIISLVPSQTELLFHLGLEDEVIGITKFCVHPYNWFRNKKRIGGTKTVDVEKVQQLKPDLIIANKEENVKDQIETLAADFPTWVTDVNNLEESLVMITDIGRITGKSNQAAEIANIISVAFRQLQFSENRKTAAYLIWKDPYMAAGGDTFISDMLERCGFINAFSNISRYPVVTTELLALCQPDYIFLSSEPFPFNDKHADNLIQQVAEISTPGNKLPQVICVDGEMFSWYGSRLIQSIEYFKNNIMKLHNIHLC